MPLGSLSSDAREVLQCIIAAPSAWVPLAAIDGREVEAAGLIGRGLVERWEELGGLTLTPYGAAALRVRLADRGSDRLPQWVGEGGEDDPPIQPPARRQKPLRFPDLIPAPEPEEEAEEVVEAEPPRPMAVLWGFPVPIAG